MNCPTCEKDFPTYHELRPHHVQAHGNPPPNRTCKGCDVDFYDPKSQRKFCDDCNPNAGRHNGNWKDAKETVECRLCGNTFEFYPSDKLGVYCPECVEESEEFLGTPYHEVHDIERVTRVCEYCQQEMVLLKSYVDRGEGNGRFCSHECRCLAMKEPNSGRSYNKGWAKVKKEAHERDDHTCQKCGVHESDLDCALDVHHIKPVREFDDPSEAHTLSNVVCLCRRCHISLEWKLRSITTNTGEVTQNQ